MKNSTLFLSAITALLALALWAPRSEAYPTYSEGEITNPAGDEEPYGYCKTCHGHFRATDETNSTPFLRDEYISPTDGKRWRVLYHEVTEPGVCKNDPAVECTSNEDCGGSKCIFEPVEEIGLHEIHRHVMVDKLSSSRCDTCHTRPPGFYPVYLDSSTSAFLPQLGCMGCHGRQEDAGNDNISGGLGAGLRQHHTNAGITECKTCHLDADPANYTPVGEDVLPPYYFTPDPEFPNKPTDPCNRRRAEDYAGKRQGLDNDGDGRYDRRDSDCKQ